MSERALARLCGRQQTSTPAAAVRGAVAGLHAQLGLGRPPIPLRPILAHLGADLEWAPRPYRRRSGVASLVGTTAGYRIRVHEGSFKRSWRRTRFTLAHEIVHILIFSLLRDPELIEELDNSVDGGGELERLCNIGAAELLMPAHHVREDLRKIGLGPRALLELYDKYLVSREVLVWRIAEVLPRGGVVRWRHFARHSAEEECLRVVRSYPNYDRIGRRPWLPRGATVSHIEIHSDFRRLAVPSRLEKVDVRLDGRHWNGCGVASAFPKRGHTTTPLFEGFRVRDERADDWQEDILLVLVEAGALSTIRGEDLSPTG